MTHIFKKHILVLIFMLSASFLFFLPSQARCSEAIALDKGAVTKLTDIDVADDKGGPESSFLNLQYSGAGDSNAPRKILRATAKASPESKASYWARLGTRFSIQKGKGGETYGKARITLYGLSYDRSVNTPRGSAGKATLKMYVSSTHSKTRTELNLLTASGNGSAPKIFQKEKASGSVDVHVAAGDTIAVELELVASAGTGFQKIPAEVDFYSGQKKVTFEGIRVEILNTDPLLPVTAPASKQVFFYDNSRCLNSKPADCLILNKGEQVDDLALRSISQAAPDTWNDRIACLKIGKDVSRVIVYQNSNFKGKSRTFTRTDSNPGGVWSLHGNGWDKDISSIIVE